MNQRRLPLVTTSSVKTFRRCVAEHHMRYELGLRSIADEAEALRFGTLIHAGLEAYWRAIGDGGNDPLACALDAVDYTVGEPDMMALMRARVLLRGYAARWSDDAARYKVLAVEPQFDAPLVNPATDQESRTFHLGGKLDAIVQEIATGDVYILEHKTSSESITLGSPYWRRLRMDSQISNYFVGARALGHEPVGVIYDVLAKPGMRPALATPPSKRQYRKDGKLYAHQRDRDETPEEYYARLLDEVASGPDKYFARGTVVRLAQEEHDAAADLWQTTRMMRETQLAQRWPRNADSCFRYNRACDYFDVCTGQASLDDPALFRRVESVHMELVAANDTDSQQGETA